MRQVVTTLAIFFSTALATLPRSCPSLTLSWTLKIGCRLAWLTSTARWVRRKWARRGQLDRNVLLGAGRLDVEQVVQLHGRVVRVLHGHEILVAGLDVDPEVAVDRDAGVQGGHHLLDNFVGFQPHARRLLAIHLDDLVGRVEALQHAGVGNSVDAADQVAHLLGNRQGFLLLVEGGVRLLFFLAGQGRNAGDLDVDGRGSAVVQRVGHNPAGAEADAQVVEVLVLVNGLADQGRVLLGALVRFSVNWTRMMASCWPGVVGVGRRPVRIDAHLA